MLFKPDGSENTFLLPCYSSDKCYRSFKFLLLYFNQPQKRIHYPNVPVYNDPNEKLRLTEYSPNSAKIEYGNPGEKPLITIRARNEETYTNFNGTVQTDSKMSIKSPYLESKVKDYAKDTVMDNVVTPLRETIGKTAADTTLGVAVVATALVSAKHLPDGNVKIDIPTFRKKIISIYGTRLIDELDYVEKYGHRIAKVKNITTDITAIQITHGIPYDTIDSDLAYSYLDRYDFVKQTADDLQDYFLQNIKGHVKWVLKNSGLDYVR